MVDEAEKLAPKFTRLADAVYHVLSNNRIQDERRTDFFAKIMRILRKREGDRKREAGREAEALETIEADRARQLYLGAFAHERRQPPDTYDHEAEEQSRRAIK
jgi:hypothetical protein